MIVTYDGETMSACVYGGYIHEGELTIGAVGEPAYEMFHKLNKTTSAQEVSDALGEQGNAMVVHEGQLMALYWYYEDGIKVEWREVKPPFAVSWNSPLAIRAVELMEQGMNASQACSKVVSEVSEAGGMVNTQTIL